MQKLLESLKDNIGELTVKIGSPDTAVSFNYPQKTLKTLLGNREMSDGELNLKLDAFFKEQEAALSGSSFRRGKKDYKITLSLSAAKNLSLSCNERSVARELCRLVTSGEASPQKIRELFFSFSKAVKIERSSEDFDELIYFEDGTDSYYYLFSYEENHVEYHRLLPEDFEEIYNM